MCSFYIFIHTTEYQWTENISTFCIQEIKVKLNHACMHASTHTHTHKHTLCDLHARPWHVLTANSPSPETKPDEKQNLLQHWRWFVKTMHSPVLILFDTGYTIRSISFVVRVVVRTTLTWHIFTIHSNSFHCHWVYWTDRKLIVVPVKTKWTSFVQTHKRFKRMLFIRTKMQSANVWGNPLC